MHKTFRVLVSSVSRKNIEELEVRGRNPPFLSLLVSSSFSPPPRQTEEIFVYFFTDTLFVHSFLAYGTTPPYHSRLKSQFLFSGEGVSSGVDNTCISKNTLFQTNKIYLPPAFYPSFTLVMFTSRTSVTLNLPFN